MDLVYCLKLASDYIIISLDHNNVYLNLTKGTFFWAYSGIGIVGISQTIVRSQATLIPEWL